MRKKLTLTQWQFSLNPGGNDWEAVTVPHTWNAQDGQQGGPYLRTSAVYRTSFERPREKQVYVRFDGVNSRAVVSCNGRVVGEHRGGYAAFQMELTDDLTAGENTLEVMVSNEKDDVTYPAMADYTFFGGIYRGVSLLCFDGPHFSLDHFGSLGVFVTPGMEGDVHVRAYTEGGRAISAVVTAPDGGRAAEARAACGDSLTELTLHVDRPQAWAGRRAPRLYTLHIALDEDDELDIPFGFRTVRVDANRGFLLNGERYPLHGVSRHQDRENMGWAIGEKEHREDIDLICEVGANTVRFPHYQQAEYVLDLCDRRGLVVWAEAPLNSEYLPNDQADELIERQLMEMICQQYNHPSICFWSLANEISIGGVSERLLALLNRLNDTVKRVDPSRVTVMANIGATDPQSPLWRITDAVSVNTYLGWYEGNREDYGPFLSRLHDALPDRPLGLSEYGAEAVIKWHSDHPACMDYTEEYQALTHESAWNAIAQSEWLLGSWVWNMFDFAASHRREGGAPGRNNKGLVTYDRKTKKDAFWFYKACWSDGPFVYITGKRFTRRTGSAVDVKVYSNQREVTLSNGEDEWTQTGEHVFLFRAVPFTGARMTLTARARDCRDALVLTQISEPDPAYVLPQTKIELDSRVRQWFDGLQEPEEQIVHRDGYFTMQHMMDDIVKSEEAMEAVEKYWALPLELSAPEQASRLRKGGSMPPSQIWRYVKDFLPESAYHLLDAALAQVRCGGVNP